MIRKKKGLKTFIKISAVILGTGFTVLSVIAKVKKKSSVYMDASDQKNPLEGKKVRFIENENEPENADGVKGHLEAVGTSDYTPGFYDKYVKRVIDITLSFCGLVVLSPVFAAIALAIKIEDPGPVLFTQKRLGKNKQYFKLHKFRSMKVSTPHDVPTHMLENPEQYITKVGKFIRKQSMDELPQIWDIFIGNMSIIGPRPGLWNQDVLTAERDKYGANDVRPGLTGWAQINGRDELEIPEKAKLDGEYIQNMGLVMDIKCFLGSVHVFGKDESVVEGGTKELKQQDSQGRHYTDGKTDEELIGHIGFGELVTVNPTLKRKVLITGKGSYIGESFQKYAEEHYPSLEIDSVDMLDPSWRKTDFSLYDIVYHVAGIAHADVGKVDAKTKEKYYEVNTDLAVEVCKIAKKAGVKEFIFMSSMIVYGESAPLGKDKIIDEHTVPHPANFYGDSKLQADVAVRELADDNFKVVVLRPPMIYGKGSKGNYPRLSKLARKFPLFPDVDNKRSMLYIENLCEFLCQIMLIYRFDRKAVILIPQNKEWTSTSQMVRDIAEVYGKNIYELKTLESCVAIGSKIPGKIGGMVNKAFGNSCYKQSISVYAGVNYQTTILKESIKKTENNESSEKKLTEGNKPKALILASVASMIDQFNMQNIQLLLNKGYDVEVVCNCKTGNTISDERVQDLVMHLENEGVSVTHIPIPRKITDIQDIVKSFLVVRKMCDNNRYKLLHCHSPIGSVIARLAANTSRRKYGTKVIYTAHGFHFYKGAPKKNWIIFYPIEKWCSRITDVLITINKEDYEFAKKHMKAKAVEYIPGVGVDTEKYKLEGLDRSAKRAELGISENDLMLISVGEINQNKNQEVIIRAISKLDREHIHYFIAGKGDKEQDLIDLSNKLGVQLHLLGYRTDVVELLNAADIFVFPSFREGLSVALMEAMAAGLPCVVSRIRGNIDLIDKDGGYLCRPENVLEFCDGIKKLYNVNERKIMGKHNQYVINSFDIKTVMNKTDRIYSKSK